MFLILLCRIYISLKSGTGGSLKAVGGGSGIPLLSYTNFIVDAVILGSITVFPVGKFGGFLDLGGHFGGCVFINFGGCILGIDTLRFSGKGGGLLHLR